MSDAKVVSLNGAPIASPGEPDENVVALLRAVLERAEAGEITGVALAWLFFDDGTANNAAGATSTALLGALARCQHHVLQRMDEP